LIEIVPEQFSNDFAALKKAFDASNKEDIKKVAHSIKGAAFSMCFNQLAQITQELEQEVYNNDMDEMIKKYNSLLMEWRHIVMLLKGLSL
jgi:HPt (histidine-containing phosphotransfer) domain-containing protein